MHGSKGDWRLYTNTGPGGTESSRTGDAGHIKMKFGRESLRWVAFSDDAKYLRGGSMSPVFNRYEWVA